MAALHSRCGHYIFILWFLLYLFIYLFIYFSIFLAIYLSFLFLLFSSPNLTHCRLDVYHTSTHGVALVRI